MKLKKGTVGIIVKPKPCCGYTGGIGKMVVYEGKAESLFTRCTRCNFVRISAETDIQVSIGDLLSVIESTRVKWLNDDLDLSQETCEDKQLETI